MRKEKTVKGLGREAKERLKNGFWEKNKDEVITKMDEYKLSGVSYKEAFALYETRNREVAAASSENESFYRKVKKILDETGETSDILDRLIDKSIGLRSRGIKGKLTYNNVLFSKTLGKIKKLKCFYKRFCFEIYSSYDKI